MIFFTFREEVGGQLHLGEVPRAQVRLEAVEADAPSEGQLALNLETYISHK